MALSRDDGSGHGEHANDAAPAPAWRSLPFFTCNTFEAVGGGAGAAPTTSSSRGRPAQQFAGFATHQIHSILNLGFFPIGVFPAGHAAPDQQHQQQHAQEGASSSSSGSGAASSLPPPPSSLARDFPYLVALHDGHIALADPTTLQPLTASSPRPFQCIPPGGSVTHIEYDAATGRLVVLSEDAIASNNNFPLLRIWDLHTNLESLRSRSGRQAPDGSGTWLWRPRLLAETRIQHGRRPLPVAALAVTPGLTYLAASLSNGAVLLLRNLAQALHSASPATVSSTAHDAPAVGTLPKFKVVYQPSSPNDNAAAAAAAAIEQDPVTALAFSSSGGTSPVGLSLFIATLSRVMRYIVLGKGAGSTPITLDDIGCPLGCSVLLPAADQEEESKLLIARPEAIYILGSAGREDCYAYEGPKASVSLLPNSKQLVILSPPMQATQASTSGTVRRFAAVNANGSAASAAAGPHEVTKVSIFDLDGKFLSYNGTFPDAVRATFTDTPPASTRSAVGTPSIVGRGGSGQREDLYVLSDSGQVHHLQEKPLRDKLDILFRNGLFILASQVAKAHFSRDDAADDPSSLSSPSPSSSPRLNALLADIWIKYGDHLYEKGDYEGSMKMGYLKSVGAAAAATLFKTAGVGKQPRSSRATGTAAKGGSTGAGESYIIRKFLDAKRIPLLTLYLQELHRRGLANSDHTTLLLNCYTKLKDTDALDRFIRRSHVIDPSHRRADNRSSSSSSSSSSASEDEDDGGDGGDGTHAGDRLPFDLPTAIKVCRSANYFDQAAYLARKFGLGEEYLRIKVEDTHRPLEALGWLRTRGPTEVAGYLGTYAGLLLGGGDEAERETTDLLVELCSGAYRPNVANPTDALAQAARAARKGSRAGDTAGSANAKGYLRYLTGGGAAGHAAAGVASPQLQAYDIPSSGHGGNETPDAAAPGERKEVSGEPAAPYDIPSPRQFFPHFIRFPQSFRRFLETVALARWGQAVEEGGHEADEDEILGPDGGDSESDTEDVEDDEEGGQQRSIWNTLLEIYLRDGRPPTANTGDGHSLTPDRRKALRLLRQYRSLPYDVHHALVLCEQEGFTDGVATLYERMGMYEDVLGMWMEMAMRDVDEVRVGSQPNGVANGEQRAEVNGENRTEDNGEHQQNVSTSASTSASDRVLDALARYAHLDPSLYASTLRFLTSHPLLLARHRAAIEDILLQIEDLRLLSTLEIVQLLSRTEHASVGLVQGFLERAVSEERAEMEADRRLVRSYRAEIDRKQREIAELAPAGGAGGAAAAAAMMGGAEGPPPRVFQSNTCTACGGQLDLPAVHFMCRHSYHARCLGGSGGSGRAAAATGKGAGASAGDDEEDMESEGEKECPACARAYGVVREMRRGHREAARDHQMFLQEVREADDPFAAIASMFGRGVFAREVLS